MKRIGNVEFSYDVRIMFQRDQNFLFAREPVLRRLPDGSIGALIYTGGKREPAPENVAAFIRSTDDGATWSKPQVIFSHPFRCCWGTELFTEGEIPLAIFQTYDFRSNYCELRSYFSTTEDCGKNWSSPQTIPGVPPNFCVRQGKVLSDGSWIFPVYWQEVRSGWDFCCEDGKFSAPDNGWTFVSGVIRSTDHGNSFSLHGNLRCGKKQNAWEPEVTELENGHLRMFIRCECPEHVLWESDSFDYGKNWTPVRRGTIPNPGTKVVIYKIRDRFVMLNNVCAPDVPRRDRLELWSSPDCRNWDLKLPLAHLVDLPKSEEREGREIFPQVAYPHGFADERNATLYVAVDCIHQFFMVKIPYRDLE